MPKLDVLFRECTEIVDNILPILNKKTQEYAQVENLIRRAIVRTHLTGKSSSLAQGLQHFIEALVESRRLEDETTNICSEIDQIAVSLIKGELCPGLAKQRLIDFKTRLQGTHCQILFISQQLRFSHKLISRQFHS